MTLKKTDKYWQSQWQIFKDNQLKGSPVDLDEKPYEKAKRISDLEKHPERWFAYYFPDYYTCEPADFQIKATRRVLRHSNWFEVRSWSRDMAKSTRTMMEVLYLSLTGKKKNILLVSNSLDNAKRLLTPYKKNLEDNRCITYDYGHQQRLGSWEASEFITTKGVSFRALGKGQSPRGTRNEAYRPDVILIDDIDTDEECRNAERIKDSMHWIENSLIPTTSVGNHLLILVCGNLIAPYCCVSELAKKADKHDIVNIRGLDGKSSWPAKNSEADIDRMLSLLSANAVQREYFNNPVIEGDTFDKIHFDNLPRLKSCDAVLVYSDPATSNRDKGKGSTKAVGVIARKKTTYYLYKVWLDTMSNAQFIDALFTAYHYIREQNVDIAKVYIENNSLQNPFYEQVLLPLIKKKAQHTNQVLPVVPDTRKKADKFVRIEGTLEPLNRLGQLIFNKREEKNPDMQRMVAQMLSVAEKTKLMDGPDMLEGGVWILQRRTFSYNLPYLAGPKVQRHY